MMQRNLGLTIAVSGAAALVLVLSTLFTVHQTEQALVLQFGQPRALITQPGLHAKVPFIQRVVYFDRRVLNLDMPAEEVIAEDKKRLVVDAFARWRITDALRFNQALTDEDVARVRLSAIVSSNLRRVLGAQNFSAVLSSERSKLMRDIRDGVNAETKSFGIQIVDVRIRRTDLPAAIEKIARKACRIESCVLAERLHEAGMDCRDFDTYRRHFDSANVAKQCGVSQRETSFTGKPCAAVYS